MASSESSGSAGAVAIVAIVFMLLIAALIAWRMGAFGGGSGSHTPSIEIHTPSSK